MGEVDIFKCCSYYLLQGIIVAIETVSKRLNQSAICKLKGRSYNDGLPFFHPELSSDARAVLLVITNNSQRVCVLCWLTCKLCAFISNLHANPE